GVGRAVSAGAGGGTRVGRAAVAVVALCVGGARDAGGVGRAVSAGAGGGTDVGRAAVAVVALAVGGARDARGIRRPVAAGAGGGAGIGGAAVAVVAVEVGGARDAAGNRGIGAAGQAVARAGVAGVAVVAERVATVVDDAVAVVVDAIADFGGRNAGVKDGAAALLHRVDAPYGCGVREVTGTGAGRGVGGEVHRDRRAGRQGIDLHLQRIGRDERPDGARVAGRDGGADVRHVCWKRGIVDLDALGDPGTLVLDHDRIVDPGGDVR